eukprot:TRINITY_DN65011_c0_g1_i1.p1 TRINITY_DN65011_c0_g1~~TRINITY_DN65011_c0_g1_i1.p1  ORF type:complete len:438 (+),score=77.66 TRINITY_DN65011_c0_g1_i1:120-1433(+)
MWSCCAVCRLGDPVPVAKVCTADTLPPSPSQPSTPANKAIEEATEDTQTLEGSLSVAGETLEVGKPSAPQKQVLPFTRLPRAKNPTFHSDDGGTSSEVCGKPSRQSVQLMRQHTLDFKTASQSLTGFSSRGQPCFHSHLQFAEQNQTVIVFDWDDTLFPTTFIQDSLEFELDWDRPLKEQDGQGNVQAVERTIRRMATCETQAALVLSAGHQLAHIVIVTLASAGWVDASCANFYPEVGRLIKELGVPIIYAQEHLDKDQVMEDTARLQTTEEVMRFWGLKKGIAISQQLDKFYSQYQGQSWKNVLSIGDSSFERYGLFAATTAYMLGSRVQEGTDLGWCPSQEGCWTQIQDGCTKKLRAKCCKLVDQPDIEELQLQLELLADWLEPMVQLDSGFDLDLEAMEEMSQVQKVDAVLRGKSPISELPAPKRLVQGGVGN